MNQMSKFELNPMVNELGKLIILKLHISEKYTVASDCPTRPKYEK